ncbi:MAG TPA: twin-arginine translocase TatA/TatE family subunit [Alphaproteobacteria bacterium]|jgi:sec-independent protein translocase protein TatA|nr:twin-arginine translocase TatA/TatE family subunit [Alphaproteobacteria bacterium]
MGTFSLWHVLLVLLVVLILFGAGRLPQVMGDLAKGLKNFKSGLKDEPDDSKPGQGTARSDSSASSDTKK